MACRSTCIVCALRHRSPRALIKCRVGQVHVFQVRHHLAEHGALAAACGDHTFGGARFDIADAVAGAHGGGGHVPIDSNGLDLIHRPDQTLVAQITQHQQLGHGAQGHQGDQLSLVNEHS